MTEIERLSHNSANIMGILERFLEGASEDIEFDVVEPDGSVTTKVIPNVKKIQTEVNADKEAYKAELLSGKEEFQAAVGAKFDGTQMVQPNGTPIPGLIGFGFKKTVQRERVGSYNRLTELTLRYTKKSDTSILVVQSYIFGEINGHNTSLRLMCVHPDGTQVPVGDGNHGEATRMLKVDEGGYTGDDVNSTPGTASHTGVMEGLPNDGGVAKGDVEFQWYVSAGTFQLNGSWKGSYESSTSVMTVMEIEV